MTEVQKFIVALVGGLVAIVIGIAGLTDPPILSLGNTLAVALIIAGLGILGVGPINAAYNSAKASDMAAWLEDEDK
jgi:hypothetical protein